MSDENADDEALEARKKLTVRERVFIAEYFRNGMKVGKAWITCNPGAAEGKGSNDRGAKMLQRIKAKTVEWERILEAAGLDDYTLAGEVRKKLRAKKTKFYRGQVVATTEDNATQMRAVELLADLRGRRKTVIDLDPALTPKIEITEETD